MTESNFHKWNEPLYYEIINIIASKDSIKYEELLTILDRKKEQFHLKYMEDTEYHNAIDEIIVDLDVHDIIDAPIVLMSLSNLRIKELIPLGADLFEYLRDKGVI